MGDSLHTRPIPVRYQGRSVLYVATNQGVLHAIDATHPDTYGDTTGGDEIWGFIPQQLLPNLALHGGTPTAGKHLYGLDGGITRWYEDFNRDGIVNGRDELLLISGQQRGGHSYFALDFTDPLTPMFKWQITGGRTSGFGDLMQTWSQPALITVAHSGYPARGQTAADAQRVLVFGGGYDDTVFDGASSAGFSGGGALYMVDKDGNLLWRTENKMQYSMPADLAMIDSNDDFRADRIYAADLGGQIWRVDLADLSSIENSNVMLLASAASDGYQPFFYPPSISYTYQDRKDMLAVSIGSGNRTDPLKTPAQHYLYMFRATYDGDPALCESSFEAESRLYSLVTANGNPAMDSGGNRTSSVDFLIARDRSEEIPGNGISSAPVTVFPQEGIRSRSWWAGK